MRTRYIYDKETRTFIESNAEVKPRVEAPFVQTDSMDLLKHHGNGKYYDSKSGFRRVTKALGYEERGDAESVADNKPKMVGMTERDYHESIQKSWAQLKSGTAPLSEFDREVCRRTDERLRNR